MLDRLLARLGIYILTRLFVPNCQTDIRDDFPGENLVCTSCEAKRLITCLRELYVDWR